MKLCGQISIELTVDDFVAAADHQRRLEDLLALIRDSLSQTPRWPCASAATRKAIHLAARSPHAAPFAATGGLNAMRTRNSILQALHLMKSLDARISVNEVIAFLYAAENEGLTVQEMAYVAGLTQSTASRSLRALGPPDSDWSQAPALGLVEAYLNPKDGRSHVIQLSAKGREMRDRLDRDHPPGGDHPARRATVRARLGAPRRR